MYLIDTNVMLAASAVRELSNVVIRTMPQEIELRERVFGWLMRFELSERVIVLDEVGLIRHEYDRNLPFNYQEQEYGMQVLQNKLDNNLVCYVPIDTLQGNGEHIAILQPAHQELVPDREDRKWVASALAVKILLERFAPIVYGAETDWFMAEEQLKEIGVLFVRLLPDDWYQSRLALR